MTEETAIEKSIKNFVFSKIGEQVFVDLSKSAAISVKHSSKRGSTALAIFWMNVLQHKNNYPVLKYPYRKICDSNGSNKVTLQVDDVTLTIFMRTGTLMIQGNFMLNWFLDHFLGILNSYDLPVSQPREPTDTYKTYQDNWTELTNDDKAKESVAEKERLAKEDKALVVEGLEARGDNSAVEKLNEAIDEAAEELELLTLDSFTDETLQSQLGRLRTGGVKDGPTYIYKMWKSLLDLWFADENRKVFIVTPFLDSERLVDICQLILKHRLTAHLDAMYVRQSCDHNEKISDVKHKTLKSFDAKDQMFVEYKIYSNIIYPLTRFHAKFIASVKDHEAEVLITSANFHADHFVHSNAETVQYLTMSEVDFVGGFLRPINASVEINK